ncbi:Signal peptidase complex subunit 3, partial [Perkinsus olseni]
HSLPPSESYRLPSEYIKGKSSGSERPKKRRPSARPQKAKVGGRKEHPYSVEDEDELDSTAPVGYALGVADSPAAECRSSEISRHVIVRNRTQQDRIDVLMGIQEPFGKLISVVYPSSVIAGEDLPPPFTRALLGLDPGERILLK